MFYVIAVLWLLACGIIRLLGRVRVKSLKTSCPCVAVGGLALFGLLLALNQTAAAWIVLLAALYFWVILRWTVSRQRRLSLAGN